MNVGVRAACLCEQPRCSAHIAPAVISESTIGTDPVTKRCIVSDSPMLRDGAPCEAMKQASDGWKEACNGFSRPWCVAGTEQPSKDLLSNTTRATARSAQPSQRKNRAALLAEWRQRFHDGRQRTTTTKRSSSETLDHRLPTLDPVSVDILFVCH